METLCGCVFWDHQLFSSLLIILILCEVVFNSWGYHSLFQGYDKIPMLLPWNKIIINFMIINYKSQFFAYNSKDSQTSKVINHGWFQVKNLCCRIMIMLVFIPLWWQCGEWVGISQERLQWRSGKYLPFSSESGNSEGGLIRVQAIESEKMKKQNQQNLEIEKVCFLYLYGKKKKKTSLLSNIWHQKKRGWIK